MDKKLIAVGSALAVMVIGITIFLTMWASYSNDEHRLRNTIIAKQRDNQNQMDLMWKSISQSGQVAETERSTFIKLFTDYAHARTGGESHPIMNWIKESVPEANPRLFASLMNIVVSQRTQFAFRQKELLDLKREHDNLIDLFPSCLFVGGRGKIDVTIVTSSRTEDAFKSGKDDNVQMFGK